MKLYKLTVICILAVSALTLSAASRAEDAQPGTPATSYQDAIDHWIPNQNNRPVAEFYLREALRLNPPDTEAARWVLDRLSWTLAGLHRSQEALQFAEQAWKTLPNGESLATLLEASTGAGDLKLARQCARYAEYYRDKWGDQQKRIEDVLPTVRVTEVRITCLVTPDRIRDKRTVIVYPPISETATQEVLSLDVQGAEAWERKTDDLGNVYLEIARKDGEAFKIITTIRVKPASTTEALAQPGPKPKDAETYLGKSVGRNKEDFIDPMSEIAQDIVRPLMADDPARTAANILNWFAAHIKYDPSGMRNSESSDSVLSKMRGHCEHCATAQVALFRAAGIPARLVRGWNIKCIGKAEMLQHSVCEYLLNGVWLRTNYEGSTMPGTMASGFVCRYHYRVFGDPGVKECILDGSQDSSSDTEAHYYSEVTSSYIPKD